MPSSETTGAPRTLTVVAVALFAVTVDDRKLAAPWRATVTTGGTENVPTGQVTVTFPAPSVTPVARSTRPEIGV